VTVELWMEVTSKGKEFTDGKSEIDLQIGETKVA